MGYGWLTMPIEPQKHPRRSFLKALSTASAAVVIAGNAPAVLAADTPSHGPVPKRKFGRHDEMVSSLALGGATLAHAESIEVATRIAHAAIDMGVTFFDNAWEYANGRAEEWMGVALQGKRDQVFLMTKVCTHMKGAGDQGKGPGHAGGFPATAEDRSPGPLAGAPDSDGRGSGLRFSSPTACLRPSQQARKQGKIRYCGFTGHADPKVHLRVLAHHYAFDSVQMPLSVFDAHENGFQKLVLPEARKQGIAPLAMKTLAGNAKPIKDGLVTSDDALRYALSLPVTAVVSGIDTMEWLQQNAKVAASFKPFSAQEMAELEQRCSSKKQYEYYRRWAYYDSGRPNALLA